MFWEDDIGGSPVESSGVSGGFSSSNSDLSQPTGSEPATQPSEPVIEFEPVQLPEGPPYACPYLHCKKVYKTQGWYRNHQAAHKINGMCIDKIKNVVFIFFQSSCCIID